MLDNGIRIIAYAKVAVVDIMNFLHFVYFGFKHTMLLNCCLQHQMDWGGCAYINRILYLSSFQNARGLEGGGFNYLRCLKQNTYICCSVHCLPPEEHKG